MKKLLIILFSLLISFNSWGETKYSYYDNGQKKADYSYVGGSPEGRWTDWYGNGQKKYERNYKNANRNEN